MNEYLLSGLIGAVVGYVANAVMDAIKMKLNNTMMGFKVKKIKDSLSSVSFKAKDGYMALDHAVPQYKEKNIKLKNTNKTFVYPIPNTYRETLENMGFKYNDSSDYRQSEMISTFNALGIKDCNEALTVAANEVAQSFIDDLKQGYIRFNGYLFGVSNIHLNRVGEEEDAVLSMELYKTDYFTYRVFANLYKKYRDRFNLNSIADFNKIPHFLSSFGLGCFIIASDGVQDYMIIAHRGSNVIVDKDRYHFSMNEAFSMLDVDMFGNPSLVSCLYRGLKEELGINEAYNSKISEFGFLDLSADIDRLECGISCYVKMTFDAEFTIEQFSKQYSTAKDKELETKNLHFVPMKELQSFISSNAGKLSAGCKHGLESLLARYEAGQI